MPIDIKEFKIKLEIPDGYEFGGVDDNNVILIPKQPKYPKTYVECCKVLDIGNKGILYTEYNKDLLQSLQKLIICRDAYWEIAGKELGLEKPWKPDWESLDKKYNIYNYRGNIKYDYNTVIDRCLLVFPTVEMRDVFYKNFKGLIEQCKELL